MRYVRYAFLASLAFVLVLLAVANREMTTLSLLPAELNDIAPFAFSINLPVFSVFFLGIFFIHICFCTFVSILERFNRIARPQSWDESDLAS